MEERDIIMCLKKRNKDEKNIKEIIVRLKNPHNFFYIVSKWGLKS